MIELKIEKKIYNDGSITFMASNMIQGCGAGREFGSLKEARDWIKWQKSLIEVTRRQVIKTELIEKIDV